MIQIFLTAALTLIFVNPFASADFDKLLENRHRPTIADIKREFTAEEILKNQPTEFALAGILQSNIFNAATVIAELEWAYPGAIYMALGRDAAFIGDIIDAFYHSQGKPGRVIRLNASGPSLEVPLTKIARWIESTGIDIKNLANGPSYVLVDSSGYNLPIGSQSTKILKAVYDEYVRYGGQTKDILTKFAFFNFVSPKTTLRVNQGVSRVNFLREQYEYLEKNPFRIPSMTFGSTTHAYDNHIWHGSFGLLTEGRNGQVFAAPSGMSDIRERQFILKSLFLIMSTVTTTRFTAMVQARANQLGYEFKLVETCDSILRQ